MPLSSCHLNILGSNYLKCDLGKTIKHHEGSDALSSYILACYSFIDAGGTQEG